LAKVNMKPPDCEQTDRMAFGLVLVASIVSSLASHVASTTPPGQSGAGAPGLRVMVAVR
jgi:hypothetical protein